MTLAQINNGDTRLSVRTKINSLIDSDAAVLIPQQFGAVGNGVADDTVAIKAAYDSGLPVFIPNGTYNCPTWTDYTPTASLKITGESRDAIIVGPDTDTTNHIVIANESLSLEISNIKYSTFRHLIRLDGATAVGDITLVNVEHESGESGIVTYDTPHPDSIGNVLIRDCFFHSYSASGWSTQGCHLRFDVSIGDVLIENNRFEDFDTDRTLSAVSLQDDRVSTAAAIIGTVVVRGNTIRNFAQLTTPALVDAIYGIIAFGDNVVIQGNYVENYTAVDTGTIIDTLYTKGAYALFDSNYVLNAGNKGAVVCKSSRATITNNHFKQTSVPPVDDDTIGIRCDRTNDIVIKNNHVYGFERGIRFDNGEGAVVTGNVVTGCTLAAIQTVLSSEGSKGVTITDNAIHGFAPPSQRGLIIIQANGYAMNEVLIANNRSADTEEFYADGTTSNTSSGVWVLVQGAAGSVSNVQIKDNIFDENVKYVSDVEVQAGSASELVISGNTGTPLQVSAGGSLVLLDYVGSGVPTETCADGSTYTRLDGGAGTTFYKRENSSWVPDSTSAILTGAVTPVSAVTPDYIGQEYLDTTSTGTWYKSTGLTNTDWVALN